MNFPLDSYGIATNLGNGYYLHYYTGYGTATSCDQVNIYLNNGALASYSGIAPPKQAFDKYTKMTLVKTDNSVYTFNLGISEPYGNYLYRTTTNCYTSLFNQWYTTPSMIKEIRLHN
jgi:hypothetical protein